MRRDHEEIESVMRRVVDPAVKPAELVELLDALRLGLAMHAAAEIRLFDTLRARAPEPRIFALLAMRAHDDHVAQHEALHRLERTRPGSLAWYDHALELCIAVHDHDHRAEQDEWALREHVDAALRADLATQYATQRMLVLATASPLHVADQRISADSRAHATPRLRAL